VVQNDEYQPHVRIERGHLIFQPNTLLAAGQERRIAVQRDREDPAADGDRVPAAALQLGKLLPPERQALRLLATGKFMVAERRVHKQVLVAPEGGLAAILGVVGRNSMPRQIPVDKDGCRVFVSDPGDQCPARGRV
jgi:hypothetical protein